MCLAWDHRAGQGGQGQTQGCASCLAVVQKACQTPACYFARYVTLERYLNSPKPQCLYLTAGTMHLLEMQRLTEIVPAPCWTHWVKGTAWLYVR